VKVPVTLKMRMGWDHRSLNAPELAGIAEDLGVRMITVHGAPAARCTRVGRWSFVARSGGAAGPGVVNGISATIDESGSRSISPVRMA
jgi:tRNA-dihydrouridine synthase B